MGTSYDRRINLYINGKEVANNVKSIRAEMTKLINEQSRMTIGSQEYIAATSRIRNLKVTLAEHNQEINKISSSWSMKSLADGVSKYFYLMTAGIATITGVIFSFKQLVKTFNDFQERVSNLSALTGLSGRSLEWLAEKAHELSTSVLEGGIRIKQSAIDIVDGFTKMGSLRPELLKHKEDLVEVTKQALILAAASKSEMGPAIEAVAASMNQFGLKASDANRIINVLGAGALAGGALVGHLTESLSTVGTVAHNSNMTLEQTVGVLETLAEHQLKGEEAGTQLKTSLISLKASGLGYTSGIFNMRDAIVELKSKMDAKNTALQKDNELITIFGKRNSTVGTILTENIDRFDYFTKAVTGTNTAMIQAAINTDNNNAKLAQAHNRVSLVAEQLGEKLAPALTSVTGWFGKTLTILLALVNGFAKYAPAIITATTAIIAYSVASKISSIWEERNNKEKLLSIVITKAQALATRAQIAAVALYDLSIALLSGNLQKAAVSFRRFTLAMEANPIGLIIGLVVAAGTAFYFYTKQLSATQQAQKALNDINLDAQKRVIEERVAVGMLIDIARNENLSKMVRLDAIRKLNEISPKYLGYLNLENIATAKVDQSVKDYTDSLLENAKTEAAREALVEIEKQRLDDVLKVLISKLQCGRNYGLQWDHKEQMLRIIPY